MVGELIKSLGNPYFILMQNNIDLAKYLPVLSGIYKRVKHGRDVLFGFYEKQVKEHQKRVDHDSEPTDFVEAFLREKAKKEEAGEEHAYT
jgi:hypothetical protein